MFRAALLGLGIGLVLTSLVAGGAALPVLADRETAYYCNSEVRSASGLRLESVGIPILSDDVRGEMTTVTRNGPYVAAVKGSREGDGITFKVYGQEGGRYYGGYSGEPVMIPENVNHPAGEAFRVSSSGYATIYEKCSPEEYGILLSQYGQLGY